MDETVAWLLTSLLISSVGVGLFLYGKKQARIPQVVIGIILVAYSYFVPSVWLMLVIGVALIAILWILVRFGY